MIKIDTIFVVIVFEKNFSTLNPSSIKIVLGDWWVKKGVGHVEVVVKSARPQVLSLIRSFGSCMETAVPTSGPCGAHDGLLVACIRREHRDKISRGAFLQGAWSAARGLSNTCHVGRARTTPPLCTLSFAPICIHTVSRVALTCKLFSFIRNVCEITCAE